MALKLQKAYVHIVGPHARMSDWQEIEVEVSFDFGETADYCPYQEHFRLSASRTCWDGYYNEAFVLEPEWKHCGYGSRQYDMEQALKYLKAFNKYLANLPIRPRTLPELLHSLLTFYKPKQVSYSYYPHQHSGSTDHQKDAYPARVIRILEEKWEQLLELPSKPKIDEAA